jgi:sRNA-binding carbon storage regulator CsrA
VGEIIIKISEVNGRIVRLTVFAPRTVRIAREELLEQEDKTLANYRHIRSAELLESFRGYLAADPAIVGTNRKQSPPRPL